MMNKQQAKAIAKILKGEVEENEYDTDWLVKIHRNDGHLIVLSDEAVVEYVSEGMRANGQYLNGILLEA